MRKRDRRSERGRARRSLARSAAVDDESPDESDKDGKRERAATTRTEDA